MGCWACSSAETWHKAIKFKVNRDYAEALPEQPQGVELGPGRQPLLLAQPEEAVSVTAPVQEVHADQSEVSIVPQLTNHSSPDQHLAVHHHHDRVGGDVAPHIGQADPLLGQNTLPLLLVKGRMININHFTVIITQTWFSSRS